MEYESTRRLIEENQAKVNFAEFGRGISFEWIEKAQARLGVRFSPSYIWWLKNYSGGEINGDEIFSVYGLDFDSIAGGDIVYMNELYQTQENSVLERLVIQHNDQGEDYYFDLNQVDLNGESPIYVDPPGKKYADNFLHFLRKKIEE